jgi:hypothetical protein
MMHFIHPKVQKYIQKCLKIAPDIIPTSKISKNQFFPSVKRPKCNNSQNIWNTVMPFAQTTVSREIFASVLFSRIHCQTRT